MDSKNATSDVSDPSWVPLLLNKMVHAKHQEPLKILFEVIKQIDATTSQTIEREWERTLIETIGHWDMAKQDLLYEQVFFKFTTDDDDSALRVHWVGEKTYGYWHILWYVNIGSPRPPKPRNDDRYIETISSRPSYQYTFQSLDTYLNDTNEPVEKREQIKSVYDELCRVRRRVNRHIETLKCT